MVSLHLPAGQILYAKLPTELRLNGGVLMCRGNGMALAVMGKLSLLKI